MVWFGKKETVMEEWGEEWTKEKVFFCIYTGRCWQHRTDKNPNTLFTQHSLILLGYEPGSHSPITHHLSASVFVLMPHTLCSPMATIPAAASAAANPASFSTNSSAVSNTTYTSLSHSIEKLDGSMVSGKSHYVAWKLRIH